MKKYHIIPLGCQMNKSDGERLEQVLNLLGFQKTDQESEADLVAVISCSVRQTAMDRIHGKIRNWEMIKQERPLLTLLTGCVLPHDKEHLAKKFDIFLDINDIPKLPQFIAQFPGFELSSDAIFSLSEYNDYFQVRPSYHECFRAFVPIMTGCDKFCTYCAVPFTRGRERSRSVREVLSEIHTLVEAGCLEVTLLGQNVNSYHPKDPESFSKYNPYTDAFASILWEINQIPELDRIHFTAPHPKDMGDEAIDALAMPKHVRYLHLPMQSGDNEVLRRMNRKYTIEDYMKLVRKIRAKVPDFSLGTDIIVGFCGESEEAFQRTVSAYEDVGFDISYTAMYSPRTGTVSAKIWKDDVSRVEKKRRWNILQKRMEQTTFEKNQAFQGKTVSVLVDRYEDGFCLGNNRHYKVVKFDGSKEETGKVLEVIIDKSSTWVMEGKKG
jgi:tRNA-2-methylthio-N6-dimethylallyladenosine synthase